MNSVTFKKVLESNDFKKSLTEAAKTYYYTGWIQDLGYVACHSKKSKLFTMVCWIIITQQWSLKEVHYVWQKIGFVSKTWFLLSKYWNGQQNNGNFWIVLWRTENCFLSLA